jgi:hypothetical protein
MAENANNQNERDRQPNEGGTRGNQQREQQQGGVKQPGQNRDGPEDRPDKDRDDDRQQR